MRKYVLKKALNGLANICLQGQTKKYDHKKGRNISIYDQEDEKNKKKDFKRREEDYTINLLLLLLSYHVLNMILSPISTRPHCSVHWVIIMYFIDILTHQNCLCPGIEIFINFYYFISLIDFNFYLKLTDFGYYSRVFF